MLVSAQIKQEEKRCLVIAPSDARIAREAYHGLMQRLYNAFDERNKYKKNTFVLSMASDAGRPYESDFYNRIERRIVDEKFDLIFTFGKNCSVMAQAITTKYRTFTPIVFSAVLNPQGAGLTNSRNTLHHHITGVSAQIRNYSEQIDCLHEVVKGRIRNIILLISSGGAVHNYDEVQNARCLLGIKGFHVVEVLLDSTFQSLQNFAESLQSADLVFIPRDIEAMNYITDIVAICNHYQVPIYASDRESAKLGAALGFGAEENSIGIQAAEKALPILFAGKKPSSLPVEPMTGWKPKIALNVPALYQQGGALKCPLKQLTQYENIEIINS